MAKKILKDTAYCQILNQGEVKDNLYTYSIERIYIKDIKQEEIRFTLYKDTVRKERQFIPRPVDVTEKQLLDLLKEGIKKHVLTPTFVKELGEILDTN